MGPVTCQFFPGRVRRALTFVPMGPMVPSQLATAMGPKPTGKTPNWQLGRVPGGSRKVPGGSRRVLGVQEGSGSFQEIPGGF